MKALTKEQKIEAYGHVLKLLENSLCDAICDSLYRWLEENELDDTCETWIHKKIKIKFPEFWKQKPEKADVCDFWWPTDDAGNKHRIKILTQIIDELKR